MTREIGQIGPNAIIRAAEALRAMEAETAAMRVFRAAGIEHYLAQPPTDMVPQADVSGLQRALHTLLGDARARSISWIAGQRTADYLLAHRIPGPIQRLLHGLPPWIGARILMKAIRRNSWTFIGTGHMEIEDGNPTRIAISHCALCHGVRSDEPCCDYYAATFERLFARLVHPDATAIETHCEAAGDDACRFEMSWPR
jgi:divinyl protochlorophyllide a 8-vinyl-reductase